MRTEKYVFSFKKMFMNRLKIGLPQRTWVGKTVLRVKKYGLSAKNSSGRSNRKEDHTDSLPGSITIDLLEKGATVITASYCQILR